MGVNARLSPDGLPPGFAAYAENYRFREGGAVPRKGVMNPGWLNLTEPGYSDDILPSTVNHGAGSFKEPGGEEWALVAADGEVYRCRPHNCRQSIALPLGVKVRSACTFTQAFNKVFCFRGRYLAPLVMGDLDTGFEDLVQHWDSAATYDAAVVATSQTAEEISYGPFQAVTSITSVGDIATVTTTLEHGYVTGADVTIRGANEAEYNGRFNITVVDDFSFTFQFTGGTSPATGTITCSNMRNYWKALGSRVTLTSLTRVGTTATATKNGHGFSNGQYVTVAGAAPDGFNGTFQISNATANTFDYVLAADPGADGSGTITARTSIVLAAQSPDSNPEAWQQIYNVLPNADDALYINNRLLVPTAYTPGSTDYDSSSSYTKKDFIVATDIQDFVHFDFANQFRINQGSDDEIVCLVKYGHDTALVFKSKSWGVLSNIALDLSNLALDMRQDGYGACARAAVVAGKDVLFPVTKRGVVSVQQNELGELRSVDIPFSNDLESVVARINWNSASRIRLGYWDDKLFVAVPLDGSAVNNAMMVYDFRCGDSGAWQGVDTGEAITPKEFFLATYLGMERLCFIAESGYTSIVEMCDAGDHVFDADVDGALAHAAIVQVLKTRGYRFGVESQKRFKQMQVVLAVHDATFSIYRSTGAVNSRAAVVEDESFSRFAYIRPFNRAPYVEGNVNGDFETPGRSNYSVIVPDDGLEISEGLVLDLHQEITRRVSMPKLFGRYVQIEVWNTLGRCEIKSIEPVAGEGQRRGGAIL